MKIRFFLFLFTLYFLAACQQDDLEYQINFDLFDDNCNLPVDIVQERFTKVLTGYPEGYELMKDGIKYGVITNDESVMSSLIFIPLKSRDLLEVTSLLSKHNVYIIGNKEDEKISEKDIFTVQSAQTYKIFICQVYEEDGQKEFILECKYDCIK